MRIFEKRMYYKCLFFFSPVCCVFVRHEIVNGFGVRFVFVSNSSGLRTMSNNDSIVLLARYYRGVKNNVFH